MEQKLYYILHGLGAGPGDNWFPWLKKTLEKQGAKVIVPALPDSNDPKLSQWLETLNKIVAKNGKGTLIGHSLGGVLAVHYLLAGGKADQVVLVAPPFFQVDELPRVAAIDNFLTLPENIDNLNFLKNDFVVFYSEEDPLVPHSHGEEWSKLLNARKVVLPKMHFLIREFPEILKYLN